MRRVAITGISGQLGFQLARELTRDPDVEFILGLDLEPPPEPLPRLTFVQHDITQPFGDLFLEHWIDTAAHLAFCSRPLRDRAREKELNLAGTDRFLDAAHRAGILQLLVTSCAVVYGSMPGPGAPVQEDAPLRASESGFGYAQDKVAQEARCVAFELEHPEVRIIRVRSAAVLGPGASHRLAWALGRNPLLLPRKMGPLQACHPEDLGRALHALLKGGARGPFNVAPNDVIDAAELGALLGRRSIPVPRRALRAITRLGWQRGWDFMSDVPPEALPFYTRPVCISSRRLQQEFDFRYRYSTRETFQLFARDQRRV